MKKKAFIFYVFFGQRILQLCPKPFSLTNLLQWKSYYFIILYKLWFSIPNGLFFLFSFPSDYNNKHVDYLKNISPLIITQFPPGELSSLDSIKSLQKY